MATRPTLTSAWRLSRGLFSCRSTKYLSTSVPRHQNYDATIANLNIDKDTRVIYQGFTGKAATLNAKDTIAYGTNVVGGVSPGKGGQEHLGLPVFNTVKEAMEQVKPHATSVFVPAQFAAAAIIEAIEAEVPLVVTVAEHIPVHDMMRVHGVLKTQSKTRLVGPNCPGIIAPEQCRIGIMPHKQYKRGTIGIVSKSGTLSYEAVGSTSNAGLGQSLVVGMGGDMLPGMSHGLDSTPLMPLALWRKDAADIHHIGTTLVDALKLFFDHPGTEGIIVIGEIGGEAELRAAEAIKEYRRRTTEIPKPIIAMVAGKTAPEGRTMGHAGALLQSGDISAEAKAKALADSGAIVVPHPGVMGPVMKDLISSYTDRIRMNRYPLGSEVEYLTATTREL
ncbi:succinyl synthetase alpha subunit [Fusarium napiforme]|uniref:Succinyl synthetase alpha subunit n=1 Tax=Fusarium napiforme TaxID=42672 RepID=A0A8H5MX70_9HYPO|nr:succinyl synthetase alpha subunit [Fusarium napiforme]